MIEAPARADRVGSHGGKEKGSMKVKNARQAKTPFSLAAFVHFSFFIFHCVLPFSIRAAALPLLTRALAARIASAGSAGRR
jgi:hypothetical protein